MRTVTGRAEGRQGRQSPKWKSVIPSLSMESRTSASSGRPHATQQWTLVSILRVLQAAATQQVFWKAKAKLNTFTLNLCLLFSVVSRSWKSRKNWEIALGLKETREKLNAVYDAELAPATEAPYETTGEGGMESENQDRDVSMLTSYTGCLQGDCIRKGLFMLKKYTLKYS